MSHEPSKTGEVDQIHLGDCVQLLKTLPDGCAGLIVADPPYNIGPRFGKTRDWQGDPDWLPWCC